ncbi:MAG: T9SS type A sorting domain-containing protein, partial [Candidatus Aegiribacteria sp.]|nr:T9SS type A sorting domain-containing protein [Candidatus Aegiribacteria sp.]
TDVWLFDYPDVVSSGVLDQLGAMSISVTEFSGAGDLLPAALSLTGQSVACVYKEEMQSLPAALAAARYGGYVLQLPESLDRSNMQAMADLRSSLPMGNMKLDAPVPGAKAYGSAVLAAEFYDFLDSLGGSDPSQLEYVLTFSDQTVFPATFERSISGDLSDPTRDGAVAGRFPLEWIDNIGTINRGALYDAVIHANPRPDHVTIAMNAYEVDYWSDYTFEDNWYSDLVVNEVFGWPEEGWTAANNYFPGWPPSQPTLDPMWPTTADAGDTGCCPGQFATFYGEGYESHFHSGAQPGTGTHPSQPTVALCGFVQDVIDGSTFLYFSCHGGGTEIAVRVEDNGVAQDNYTIEFEDPYWPDSDGRVYDGSAGGDYYQSDLDDDFDNMHSVIIAYNACGMANGEMNEIGLNHGAIGSIGSLASVSFDGSGWWWNMWVHLITAEDFTTGEAAAYCNARISTVYTPPGATPGVDETLQYVLYGDPMVTFVDPGAAPPVPLSRHIPYGLHYPDGSGVGIEGQEDIVEPGISIGNPVRSTAVITLGGYGPAELNVFDLTGRLVATPYQGDINGSHTFYWNAGDLVTGMYFLRLEQGGEVSTARVMVIK